MTDVTFTTTGATGIGAATGLPTGVTASWSGNTITVTGTPTGAGVFNYTIPLTGGCGVVNATGTIAVIVDNTVTAPSANPTLCINTAMTDVTFTTTGATGIGAPIGLPTGVTASWSGNTITVTGTPTGAGVFNYTIPLTGGCGIVNATGTITVTADNTVTASSADPTLCMNEVMTDVTFTTTGATGIGAAVGLPAGITASWSGNTITVTGTPTASGVFNYTIPLTGGCGAIIAAGTITVIAAPVISTVPTDPTACLAADGSILVSSVSGSSTGTINWTGTATGSIPATTLPTSIPTLGSGPYNVSFTDGVGCVSTIVITVLTDPGAPLVDPIGDQLLCANTSTTAVTFTGDNVGSVYNWTNTNAGTGLAVSGAGDIASFTATNATGLTIVSTITVTPSFAGCVGASEVFTITVDPMNTVTAPSADPILCINTVMTDITFTTTGATGIGAAVGLPAGVTASWLGNTITISGTPSASGVFNYTIPLTGGCGAINATGTITVDPDNTVTAPSADPTLCINVAMTDVTFTTTGATGIGAAIGLPAGVTASWLGNTITLTGTPIGAGVFNYTIPLTGGCGIVNATGTITVITINTVTVSSADPTLCINTVMTDVTFTTTGATGIGAAVGLPAGLTASWLGNTITISGTPTASGVFNYTIPLTGGCGTINATGTITVTADNTVTASSADPTLCINTAMTDVTFTTTGAIGIGAAVGLPAGVTASWLGNIITVTGTPTAAGVFNYTIPLTGGCGIVNATGTITVTVDNTVTAPSADPTLCINTAMTDVTFTTTGATGIGAAIGLPAGVTASWLGNIITVTGTPTVAGVFNYTIPLTGGCGILNATGTITVDPDNTVTASSADPTLCINTVMTDVTFTTTGATGIGAAVGLPAGLTASWSGNTITISGTPTAAGVFNYTIPLTGGCGILNATGTITVTADNTVTASSADPTLCILTTMTDVTFTTTGATGIGLPVGLPTGVTASWSANTITVTGSSFVSGVFNYTIPLTGGCGAINATGTITVTATPTLTLVDPAAVCSPATVDITAAGVSSTDVGSIAYYSDMAMTIPFLTGTTAGDGIYYIEATNGTCTSSGFVTVTVVTTPVLDPFVPVVACDSYDLPVIMGTDLSGTEAYYDATGGPTVANVVTGPITSDMNIFIYDGASGCSDEQPVSITINPLPAVTNISGEDTYCEGLTVNDILVDVTGTADWNVYYSLDGTSQTATGSASPINLGNAPGVYVLDSVSDAACSNTASGTQTIIVNPLPSSPTAGTDSEYCSTVPFADMTASGGAGTMTWYSDAGLTSVISTGPTLAPNSTEGATTYYVTETLNGCEGPESQVVITINFCEITVPTAFTPDGDGVNDDWEILNIDQTYPDNMVYVYNRWGNLLFTSVQGDYDNNRWDGTYNGDDLPVGSYYFIIEYNNEENENTNGVVSIILNK